MPAVSKKPFQKIEKACLIIAYIESNYFPNGIL